MPLAMVAELVQNDAVIPFLGWQRQEFFGQRDVLLAGKAQAVNETPRFLVRRLDALADFHLLIAREQRDLAHLAQIHPHRIIQDDPVRMYLRQMGKVPDRKSTRLNSSHVSE